MTELYPEGKRLWLTVCDVRGVEPQRAELEWEQWEEGFLTRGEWQRVAERFMASPEVHAETAIETLTESVPGCGCQACRPITMSDMRMVLCSTCGNKRCPHATNHRNPCTNSNAPGQPGSSYGVPLSDGGQS